MGTFCVEMFTSDGKIEKLSHVNLPGVSTTDKALNNEQVKKYKREAMLRGLAFRVKREDGDGK